MEHLHPERAAGAGEKRALGPKTDVAVGVEVEPVQRLRERQERRIEGRAGEVARPAHHVLVAERARRRRSAALGEDGAGGEA